MPIRDWKSEHVALTANEEKTWELPEEARHLDIAFVTSADNRIAFEDDTTEDGTGHIITSFDWFTPSETVLRAGYRVHLKSSVNNSVKITRGIGL